MEDRRVLEFFAAAAFLILLIVMALLILTPTSTSTFTTTTTNVVVTDSYNQNSFNDYENDFDGRYYNRDRFGRYNDRNYDTGYLRFVDRARHKAVEGVFGQDIDKYTVYVENRDSVAGYFTVRFYFYDSYGQKNSEIMTKYVRPGEERAFTYRDLRYDFSYRNWDYKVTSESRSPKRYDYNYDYGDRYGRSSGRGY